MIITLCGSARFEQQFHEANEALTLAGYSVFSLAVFPSTKQGNKSWYTVEQKRMLDHVHKEKIAASDAIYVIDVDWYVGESTQSEIAYAQELCKHIFYMSAYPLTQSGIQCLGFVLASTIHEHGVKEPW